jgi:ABC-type lipoprotein release transport system permease subunit
VPNLAGVAMRNIVRTPRRSAIISLAVAGGAAALVFMMGMNNGLAELMVSNSVGLMLGHVQVDSAKGQRTIAEAPVLVAADGLIAVAGSSGRLEVPALVRRSGGMTGIVLFGLDAERERGTSSFNSLVIAGTLPQPRDRSGITIGPLLAEQLSLGLGDWLEVFYMDAMSRTVAVRLRVCGILRTGSEDLDLRLGVVALPLAKQFSGGEGVAKVVLKAVNNRRADEVTQTLRATLDPQVYRVRAWHEVSPFMKGMVSFQYGSINVVLAVLYLVVGAGVAAIQLLGVVTRTREFGVLAAIGFTPRRIVGLVAFETLFIGAIAVLAGLAVGASVAALVSQLGGIDVRIVGGENLEALIGLDPHLKPALDPRTFAFAVGLLAPVLVLGGVLPALRAASMTPMEALRRV